LAAPLIAPDDFPDADRSAMDGFAFAGVGPWLLRSGDIHAGSDPGQPLNPGEAVRIATGAVTPAGTTAVLRSEHARVCGPRVFACGDVPGGGRDVRTRAENWATGTILAAAGTRVTPSVVSTVLSAGVGVLHVRQPPRAHIITTGDEVCVSGPPGRGQTRDSLGPVLPDWLHGHGFIPTATCHQTDSEFSRLALPAADACDVVLVVGGTGHGPADYLRAVLDAHGAQIVVDGVACRPGGTQLTALLSDGRVVLGLPGNPLAAVAVIATTGGAVAAAMTGHTPTVVRGELTTPLTTQSPTRICPAWQCPDGTWAVDLHARTPHLATLVGRPALALVDTGSRWAELIPVPR
jgi:molybdenum cofactor synthesis domain-containing protein